MGMKDGKKRVKFAFDDLKRLLKESDVSEIDRLVGQILKQGVEEDEIEDWLAEEGVLDSENVKAVKNKVKEYLETADGLIDLSKKNVLDGKQSKAEFEEWLKKVETSAAENKEGEWLCHVVFRRLTEWWETGGEEEVDAASKARDAEREAELAREREIKATAERRAKISSWPELLDEIFTWYQMDAAAFVPVDVKSGRKFRGLGYILSCKENYGRYMGRSYETTVYKVWDPVRKCIDEFNTNMVNLFGPDADRYAKKWDMSVEVPKEKMFEDFKAYFTSLIDRAKSRCGADYRHMKNYFSACTRFDYYSRVKSGLPESLLDPLIEFIKNGEI